MRRAWLTLLITSVSLLGGAGAAQALVVTSGASGHVGVAPVPGSVTLPAQSGTCPDPWLSSDLGGPNMAPGGLCFHNQPNSVLPATETFAITWDQTRHDWSTTRDYLEQFLRDVADSSNTLGSPYAVTPQYKETPNGLSAGNKHLYGGGCIDYGVVGESTCRFPNAVVGAQGRDFNGSCTASGTSYDPVDTSASLRQISNSVCLTDGDVQGEVVHMVNDMGLIGRLQPGYQPLLVLMTPPGVDVCVDGTWCSANSTAKSKFCSYHSFVTVGNQQVAYAVQPWTPFTDCDPTNLQLANDPTPPDLAHDAGERMVSALSQAQIAAVTNPWLNGWYGLNDAETNDRCPRTDAKVDMVTLGINKYPLQTEFNNAGVLEVDPNAPACALGVALAPTFVPPSPIDAGDVVAFDGSVTVSTLMIPQAGYHWDFGDGTQSVGASVVHAFAKPGTYKVTLTVTDRGNNTSTFSQIVSVLDSNGQPVTTPTGGGQQAGLKGQLQLMPEGLKSVLRSGISLRLTSNQSADGLATLSIPTKAANQAHIKHGRGKSVVIGRGTIRGVGSGTIKLHVHLSRGVATKLRRLHHVSFTVRLTLYAAGGQHLTLDAAGRY